MKLKDLIRPKPNEQILMIVRESFIPHSFAFFLLGIWFLVPFFFFYPLFRIGNSGVIIFLVFVLSGTFFFWRAFRKWSHTLFLITDRRIVDIDQRGVFDRIVTESSFEQMDEVSYRMHGVLSAVFRYGTVRIKLHGTAADLEFEYVRNPARVQDLLNDLRQTKHE